MSSSDPTRVKSNYITVYTTILRQIERCPAVFNQVRGTVSRDESDDRSQRWGTYVANSKVRYAGARLLRALHVRRTLKAIPYRTGSQCNARFI